MRKILIIAEYFRPGYKAGGPIKSIYNLGKQLSQKSDIYILTRNHDIGEKKSYDIKSNEWVNYDGMKVYYDDTNFSRRTYKNIKLEQFDVIYLNSIFSTTSIKFLLSNRNLNKKIYLSPRGELGEGALNIKAQKKNLFLIVAKSINIYSKVRFIASAESEYADIKKIFPKNKIYIISNLSDISNYEFVNNKKADKLSLFFVSRLTRKKNINFLLNILKNFENEIHLKLIGPEEDQKYVNECKEIVQTLPSNIKVEFVGSMKPSSIYDEIHEFDYFIFPTLNENYGHVIAEALSYKKPVIISDNTPWTDYVKDNGLGLALPLDYKIWKEKLSLLSKIDENTYQLYEEKFLKIKNDNKENNKKILERYVDIFK